MTKVLVREKIISLEAEPSLLKAALTERPDFAFDEANWRKVRAVAKRARKSVWRAVYG